MSDSSIRPPPPAPAAAPATEAEASARVEAAWEDEALHRAYLARFSDLQGMAMAGQRYRAVLAERPDDAVARRMRDEVVKRATIYGLATLPRTPPPRKPRWLKRLEAAAAISFGLLAAWAAYRLFVLLGNRS
jgi:hypothetical protein